MILGDAEHQKIFGTFPVGLAEFPERAADGIQPGGRHVDRTEPAMGGVVGGAELARPPAGQRLTLVAPGEEGELFRIVGADFGQPVGDDAKRLVPLDFLELARPALADPAQRLGEARRRIMLHDPGRTLATQHALVDRVVGVAFDIADLAVAQMDLDAAAAGAHVAGRRFGFVGDLRRQIDDFLGVEIVAGHGGIASNRVRRKGWKTCLGVSEK